VFATGMREDIDLQIEIGSSAYVTQEILNKYIDEVVIPAIISNRDLAGCNGKSAVLLTVPMKC
jgi:hypothetical protein